MSKENSVIRDRLREMAQLSVLSRRISEIQIKNLQHYPFVFFNNVKSVKIDYDLEYIERDETSPTKEKPVLFHSLVKYDLELDESKNQENLNKRIFCLEEAVRILFWKDMKLQVALNGKMIYRSKK